jgi:hypothetical protein
MAASPKGPEHRPETPHVPAWRRVTEGEQRWHLVLAVLVLIGLQIAAPRRYAFRPGWLLPAVECALLIVVMLANPRRMNSESRVVRLLGLVLVGLASLATAWSAGLLGFELMNGTGPADPGQLVRDGAAIWISNVIVFALWYWQVTQRPVGDLHGPRPHPLGPHPHPAVGRLTLRDHLVAAAEELPAQG